MDVAIDLEGEFRWDVEAKHLESDSLAGDVSSRMTVREALQVEDDELDYLVRVELGGEYEVEGRFTRP